METDGNDLLLYSALWDRRCSSDCSSRQKCRFLNSSPGGSWDDEIISDNHHESALEMALYTESGRRASTD